MDKTRIAKEILTRFGLSAGVIRQEAVESYEMDLICMQFPEYGRAYLESLMDDIHAGRLKFRCGRQRGKGA